MGTKSDTLQAGQAVFYRFQDASGRVHIVDSLDLVPQAFRARAERVQYAAETPVSGLPPSASAVHPTWPIVAVAVGGAVLLGLLFPRTRRVLRIGLGFGVAAGVVALLAGAYFGWLRRGTGTGTGALASPTALIDDAKNAVEQMNARLRAEQGELKAAEQSK